ncbi:unnamed protein product [Polarella glacialis]|uniref:RRM domain-containing protein n=1 Tax=Polarella glacialis TaxID=89957 RepID=A0A813K1D5_POLGL|nr:unnamed protein product [Polarella glacialis]
MAAEPSDNAASEAANSTPKAEKAPVLESAAGGMEDASKKAGSDSEEDAGGFDFVALSEAQRLAGEGGALEAEDSKKRHRGGAKESKKRRKRQRRDDDVQCAKAAGIAIPSLKDALKQAAAVAPSAASGSAPSAAAEKAQPAEQQHEPATAASEASPPAVEAVSAPAEAVAAPVAVPAQAEAATAAPAAPPAPTRPPPTAPRAVASYADADDVAAAPQSSWTGEGGVAAAAAASEDPEVAAAVARLAKDAARRVRIAQAVNSRSVFITNLPFKATEDDIRSWLSPGGEIKEMRLSRDKATTRALGFGHVQFASPEAADEAVQKCDKVELQGRVMRLALVTAGDKFHFELPEEIKEDVRSLMREAYEGKNISCIKDAWQKRHPGQKLDMTKWGFKNFSSAMKTVESVTLEHHLTKTLTFCAFFGGSPTHLAFLEEKRKKDEEKKDGGDDAAQPAAGSGAGKRAAAEADRLPAEKKRQKVAQGSAPESAQSVDEKLAAAPSDFMTYYVTHIKTVPLDFLYARFGQAPQ